MKTIPATFLCVTVTLPRRQQQINDNRTYVDANTTLHEVTMLMDSNPIRTALEVCKQLVSRSVYAVIVSHPLNGDLSPAAVSYTSGFYHIPVIGISSRDSAFSDKEPVRSGSLPQVRGHHFLTHGRGDNVRWWRVLAEDTPLEPPRSAGKEEGGKTIGSTTPQSQVTQVFPTATGQDGTL
ncbi:Glutamate [NMDA] receptor subunit 1 [Portunus trituberculatus]|uniref:Glutamate [NMDA] receptor subunit 1 n=1 Tax=Portunus trituberculatus TaxID=210409 RepID=A0A5B7E028_PORTR|nr:Glutamate [NMDA] receptor subunit 1 [Portunus trituberculatus]